MAGRQGANRPPRYTVNMAHPLARGLVAWVDGELGIDLISQIRLAGTRDLVAHPTAGRMRRFDADGEGMEVTAPSWLRLTLPISMDVWCAPHATALGPGGAGLFGVVHNNADTAPYYSYEFSAAYDPARRVEFGYDSGGVTSVTTGTLPDNTLAHVLAVVRTAGVTLYANGVSAATAGAAVSPTYDATALLHVGNYTGVSRNPLSDVVVGRIWNRALTASDAWALYDPQTRWAMCDVPVIGAGV